MNSGHVGANGQKEADREHAPQAQTNAASECKKPLGCQWRAFKRDGNRQRSTKNRSNASTTEFFSFMDWRVRNVVHSECRAILNNYFLFVGAQEVLYSWFVSLRLGTVHSKYQEASL